MIYSIDLFPFNSEYHDKDENPVTALERWGNTLFLSLVMTNKPIEECLTKENIIEAIKATNAETEKDFADLDLVADSRIMKYDDVENPFNNGDSLRLLVSDREEAIKYLHNNPILKNYPIRVRDYVPINYSFCKKFCERYKGFNNVFVNVEGNHSFVPLEDYKYTVDTITMYGNVIKSYILSPLEQIMFAYDLTRNRPYNKEEEGQWFGVSRDITPVLKGDNIVCAGFHKLFSHMLEQLGISTEPYYTTSTKNKNGHVRTAIRIDDDKYDVHGTYYFDPTWDCKKDGNDRFSNKYSHFALTKDKMDSIDERNNLVASDYLTDDMIKQLKEFVKNKDIDTVDEETAIKLKRVVPVGKEHVPAMTLYMYKLYNVDPKKGNKMLNKLNFDLLEKDIDYIEKSRQSEDIDYHKLIDIFNVVRKIENDFIPDVFNYSCEDARQFACSRIPGCKIHSPEARLLSAIFGEGIEDDPYSEEISDYISLKGFPKPLAYDRSNNDYQMITPEIIKGRR